MADERTYIRVHDGMPDHPKIAAVGGDAGWLDVCAIAYCGRNTTDGIVPKALVPRLSDRKRPMALAEKLRAAGRWHERGHDCARCPQPGPDEYVIHDYLEHQRSAEEISDLRRKRAEAGARGGRAKANARASAKQTPEQTPEQTRGKSVPESESESESEDLTLLSPPAPSAISGVDDFDEFWRNYPRKEGKGAARKAWVKAVKKTTPDILIAAAASYRERRRGQDQQFTKTPGPWLNDERWADEPIARRAATRASRPAAQYIGDVPTWEM